MVCPLGMGVGLLPAYLVLHVRVCHCSLLIEATAGRNISETHLRAERVVTAKRQQGKQINNILGLISESPRDWTGLLGLSGIATRPVFMHCALIPGGTRDHKKDPTNDQVAINQFWYSE